MRPIIAAFVCTGALILLLVGCGSQNPQASATAVPTPCATPGAATGTTVSGSATTGPAARTTPGAAQPTVSPAELATREAVLGRTNGSGPTLPAGPPNASALPLCPTPTPLVR
jgi:hypothetical protein